MKKFAYSLALLVLSVLTAQSQESRRLIVEAENVFFKEKFEEAYYLYEDIHKEFPKVKEVNYHQEIAYLMSFGRGASLDRMLAFANTKGKSDKFYNYWLGRIHFLRYEFELSKKHFEAFNKMRAYKSAEIIKETQQYIRYATDAIAYHHDPDYYEIIQLPSAINTKADELSPVFFGDQNELIFASSSQSGDPNEFSAYYSHNFNGDWEVPVAIPELGTFDANKSKIEVVNEDGKVFVYREKSGGNLFYSENTEDGWESLTEFDSKIKKSLIESDFFINDKEDHILFSSAKGMNGLDLYQSYRDKSTKEWSAPEPLTSINSKYDEDSPYISHDGQFLYFSSNRKPASIGGFDIFRSQLDPNTNKWSEPENMGYPINTVDDELNYQLNSDDLTGYLSSNRLHSNGGFDIYYFHKIEKLTTNGQVVASHSGVGIEGLELQFHLLSNDDESYLATTNEQGWYELELPAKDKFRVEIVSGQEILGEYPFESFTEEITKPIVKNFVVDVPQADNQNTDFASLYQESSKEEVEELNMLGSKFRKGQKAVINNIYFETKSTNVSSDHDHVLEKILRMLVANRTLTVEIGGHTDNQGNPEFNQVLSLKRAEKIIELLIEMGGDGSQLIAKGYGESQPLASNDDEIDGRELNRRIEVKVIEHRSEAISTL